ncbi:MAG: RNA polymerase sigma factor [Bacteroidetes bacterium]|nr:RNA polymerase sigma factor [Bacteroidota bacterium]MBU1114250.1 RNA polymerase sigma factor [Bacteroidota bacterium]MBU1797686.1 RNA polymerase sigma factor [Bacteroidota bacterium]
MQHDYIKLLIKSAKQGKKNAYRELCNINLKKIYNIAVRFLLSEKVAEIITQDIFIEAWDNLRFLREEQSFEVWLKSIAIYRLLDETRTGKVRAKLIEENLISENENEITSTDRFENIILSLPEKERISFILHDIEKYTYEEIADFFSEMTKEEIQLMIRETRKGIISSETYV